MNYKKYLLFLLFVMIIGCNKIYAQTIPSCENESDCYYMSNEKDTFMCYNPNDDKVTISYTEENNGKTDPLANMKDDFLDGETRISIPKVGNSCPQYLAYRYKDGFLFFNSERIYGFNDIDTANKFISASNNIKNLQAYLATKTTKSRYEKNVVEKFTGGLGVTEIEGENVSTNCDDLFTEDIKSFINEILEYPKIIVPILVIVYGILDFAKAVIAGKEDEMKKAQKTFIKRVIIGVAFFFIPVFVNIIMGLADLVWKGLGYTSCNI